MGSWLERLRRSIHGEPARARVPVAVTASAVARSLPAVLAWCPRVDLNVRFCQRILGGGSAPNDIANDDERAWLAALERVLQAQDVASLVPRVPTVVPQLLHTLRDPHSSTGALSREISQDAVLVAAVVKAANSPYFGLARPVGSIEQALLVLGHDTLRQLVARVAFKPILSLQSGAFTRIGAPIVWDECDRSGVASHVLARGVGASAFEAFLAALLRNAGAIVALRILDRQGGQPGGHSTGFARALDAHTRNLARAIGNEWSFPADVVRATAEHDPAIAQSEPTSLLARLVATCERLAKARILFEAGDVAIDDLALDDAAPVAACFERLVRAPAD